MKASRVVKILNFCTYADLPGISDADPLHRQLFGPTVTTKGRLYSRAATELPSPVGVVSLFVHFGAV